MEERAESRSEAVETEEWSRVVRGHNGPRGSLHLSSPGFFLSLETAFSTRGKLWALETGLGPFLEQPGGDGQAPPGCCEGGFSPGSDCFLGGH